MGRPKGYRHSEETKRKLSLARKKWRASTSVEERRQGPRNKETKRRMSEADKKRFHSKNFEVRLAATKSLRITHLINTSKFHQSLVPTLTSVGYDFEYPIGKYFVDFAHLESKTIIEIDGPKHRSPKRIKEDRKRDRYTKSKGWRTIRVHE